MDGAPRALTSASLRIGADALARSDADLGGIVSRLGMPPVWGRRPGFATLVRIILEQQVSLAAARTMYRKIETQLGGMTPVTVRATGIDGLRALGLTRQKAAYCHGLAERVGAGLLDLAAIARGDDVAGRAMLLAVPGLGPWSVDIYYVMALRRPDVWPSGDLALAAVLREVKGLPTLPSTREQHEIAARWAPWRSVAARILWSHYLTARGRTA